MAKYLIDANLPYYISLWNSSEYIHFNDLDNSWTDEQVWDYAVANGLTIITKDSDFSNRILLRDLPPRIIHIRLRNMSIKESREKLLAIWKEVCEMSKSHKLVNVFNNRIEGIQ